MVTELFTMPLAQALNDASDSFAVSDRIQAQYPRIAAIITASLAIGENFQGDLNLIKKTELGSNDPAMINPDGILNKVISLEYEARTINKALLLRGSSSIEVAQGLEGNKLQVMGTPVNETSLEQIAFHHKGNGGPDEKTLSPYSISFGNSLFAGFINDPWASAYTYLEQFGGYALFIDKKYYIKNLYAGPYKSLDLFFIAPLAPLAALFNKGEFFHSRTKAAVEPIDRKLKPQLWRSIRFHGMNIPLIDPTGILTTERDALIHAELFAKYLAKNMRVISRGDESGLTSEEKKAYEDKIKRGQQQAGEYYKAIRVLEPFATKVTEKAREKAAKKKKYAEAGKEEAGI